MQNRIKTKYSKSNPVKETRIDHEGSIRLRWGEKVANIPGMTIEQAPGNTLWGTSLNNESGDITEFAVTVYCYLFSVLPYNIDAETWIQSIIYPLTNSQKNALDSLFRKAAYNENPIESYEDFKTAFQIQSEENADSEDKWTFLWNAKSGSLPENMTVSSQQWEDESEYVNVKKPYISFELGDSELELEMAWITPSSETQFTVLTSENFGIKFYCSENGKINYSNPSSTYEINTEEFHRYKISLENGTGKFYVDDILIANLTPYNSQYIFITGIYTNTEKCELSIKSIKWRKL